MIDVLVNIAAPMATICAAVVAAIASFKVRKQADRGEALNREHQRRLADLNHLLSIAAKQAQERYSLRAKALVEACRLAGEVCYYLERFLTPYTIHQSMPNAELLQRAEASFEALMRFRWENSLFLWENDKVAVALGEMMGAINSIRNTTPQNGTFSVQQAQHFLDSAKPALRVIRQEFSEELRRVEA